MVIILCFMQIVKDIVYLKDGKMTLCTAGLYVQTG